MVQISLTSNFKSIFNSQNKQDPLKHKIDSNIDHKSEKDEQSPKFNQPANQGGYKFTFQNQADFKMIAPLDNEIGHQNIINAPRNRGISFNDIGQNEE